MMTLDLRTFGAVERAASQALTEQFAAIFGAVDHHRRRKTGGERRPDPMAMARAKLSKRQLEVLRLIGEGKSNKEIAKLLARSPHTIKLHVSAILRQLDLKSRTQAALLSSGAATWPE